MSRDLPVFATTAYESEQRFFDPVYYKRTYPDVAAVVGIDLFEHFMRHGWVEGRNPSADFVTMFYRDKHLAGGCINPLTHYAGSGFQQGLKPAPTDPDEYMRIQIEVSKPYFTNSFYAASLHGTLDAALARYLDLGAGVKFSASSAFAFDRYRLENSYISAIGISPMYHFASQQRLLKTIPNESVIVALNPDLHERLAIAVIEKAFDVEFYLATNPSVKDVGVDPLRHYMRHGWREGRRPNAFFDPAYYLQKNPDVEADGVEPLFHYLMEGSREGRQGSAAGGRPFPALAAPSEAAWADVSCAVDLAGAKCLIIMSAGECPGTLASIYSILANPLQMTPFALIVLRRSELDYSLVQALGSLASLGYFHYADSLTELVSLVGRAGNLGEKSIVFLHGGCLVFGDWLDRLMVHEAAHPLLATLSPMGNDAEFGSYPIAGQCNQMEMEVPIDQIDRLASSCNNRRASVIPAGCVAFFLLTRAGLATMASDVSRVLNGDEVFVRARRAGLWNGLAEDVFVYRDQVTSPLWKTDQVLVDEHPDNRRSIAAASKSEPGHFGRFRLDLARLARDLPTQVGPSSIIMFVYHNLAGGILTYIRREERRLRAEGTAVIHLRVGIGSPWGVEISGGLMSRAHFPNLVANGYAQTKAHLLDFLGWIKPSAFQIHSLVGFHWTSTIDLMELIRSSQIPYDFMLHDYSVVCHRNTLVTPAGRYCGLPDVKSCRACVSSDWSYPEAVDPLMRREAYAAFLSGATAVLAPSEDIANRLRNSGAVYPIRVVPHDEEHINRPMQEPADGERSVVIVIFGAVGHDKGSDVIVALARDAAARSLPIKYHIVGYSNQTAAMIDVDVSETGPYAREIDALRTAADLSPTFVLVPSIWPETYCYTLSLAFALGVEALVFDLGAPADRVRDTGLGIVLPMKYIDDARSMNDDILNLASARSGGATSN